MQNCECWEYVILKIVLNRHDNVCPTINVNIPFIIISEFLTQLRNFEISLAISFYRLICYSIIFECCHCKIRFLSEVLEVWFVEKFDFRECNCQSKVLYILANIVVRTSLCCHVAAAILWKIFGEFQSLLKAWEWCHLTTRRLKRI